MLSSQPATSLEAPIAWPNQAEGVNSDAEKRCSSPAVLGDSAVAVVDQDGAATEDSAQARRDASARENAIRQLEKHGIDYSLELTDERKRELKPLPAIIKDGQKRRCESGYVGVSRGRKDRWQAQVDHRAIGGFATAYEAGVAVTLRMIELAQGKKPPPIQSFKNRISGKAGQQVEPHGGPPRKKWKSTPQGSPSVYFNMSPPMVEPWDVGHSDPASATSTSLGKMRKPTATIHPSLRNEGNNPAALPLAPATITMAPINNLGSFCAGAAHHHGWTLLPASNLQQSSTHIAATQHAVPTMGSMISSSYVQLLNENTRAQQAYLLAARTQLASTYEALAKCRNELDASRKAMEMLVTQTQQEPDMPSLAPSTFPALPEIPELPPLPTISELPAGLSIVEPAVLFTAPNLSSITPQLVPTSTQSSEAVQPASNNPAPAASSSRTAPEAPAQEVVMNIPTSRSLEATATRPLSNVVGSTTGPSAHQPCTSAPSTSQGELLPPLAAEQLALQLQQAVAQRQQLELYQLQLQEQVAQNHRILNALQQQRLSGVLFLAQLTRRIT
mmetsp:Transcript_28149/g.69870  ORF Transcript_28149/g.69870 Transcript_28149/m.69870 type:complete len:559 (-) Transcript_28149:200-1876(-)